MWSTKCVDFFQTTSEMLFVSAGHLDNICIINFVFKCQKTVKYFQVITKMNIFDNSPLL